MSPNNPDGPNFDPEYMRRGPSQECERLGPDNHTLAVGAWFLDLVTDACESGRIDRRQYERYMDYLVRWTLMEQKDDRQ